MTPGWREDQKRLLRERLYGCALERFREQGYQATTVDQITADAQVAKGTFFNHFQAKEHLLREWYRRGALQALGQARAHEWSSAREAVLGLLDTLAQQAQADSDLYAMKEMHAFSGAVLSKEERALDGELRVFLIERVRLGCESGELSPDLDVELFADLIVALLTGTAHEWVIGECGFSLGDVLAERTTFLLDAASA